MSCFKAPLTNVLMCIVLTLTEHSFYPDVDNK